MSKKAIGEFVKLTRGVSYKKQDAVQSPRDGYIPILRANNIVNNQLVWDELIYVPREYINESQYIRTGDIIITMSSGSKAHVGKVALSNKDYSAAFGAFCGKLVCEKINPKYLALALQSQNFRQYIESASKGTNINNLKQSHILSYEIELPDIPEQERIVSKIEELFSRLDASVSDLQTAKEKLKGYRQIVLRVAFSCIKDKVFLRSLFDGTPQNGIYKPKSAYGDGTRILRIDGFYDGFINSEYLYKRLSLSQEEIQKYGLNLFDLVINRVNSMPYLGKCALVRHISEPTVFESNIMRVRLNSEIVFPEYITYFLTSDEGRKELIKNAKQAVNQASINQTDVGNVLVPFHADIALQKQIVSRLERQLSVCNSIEQTIGTSLQQAEALRQSILKQAFEGKL